MYLRAASEGAVAALVLLLSSPAAAQTNTQRWGEICLDWIKSHDLTYGFDLEPKVLLLKPAGHPGDAMVKGTVLPANVNK